MNSIQAIVLDAIEDDRYGIWEVLWTVREALNDNNADVSRAMAIVDELTRDGVVEFELCVDDEYTSINNDSARRYILDAQRWDPQHEPSLWISLTPKGERIYRGEEPYP